MAVGTRGPRACSRLPGAQSFKRQTWHIPGTARSGWARPCVPREGMDTVGVSLRSRSLLPGERLPCPCPPLPWSSGCWGMVALGGGNTLCSANGRAVSRNMSELLWALRDCRIDFSAQLFSRVLARAISQCCRSRASALPPFPRLVCASAELHRNHSKMSCFRRG